MLCKKCDNLIIFYDTNKNEKCKNCKKEIHFKYCKDCSDKLNKCKICGQKC